MSDLDNLQPGDIVEWGSPPQGWFKIVKKANNGDYDCIISGDSKFIELHHKGEPMRCCFNQDYAHNVIKLIKEPIKESKIVNDFWSI